MTVYLKKAVIHSSVMNMFINKFVCKRRHYNKIYKNNRTTHIAFLELNEIYGKVLRTKPVFSVHIVLLMVSVYLQIKLIYRNCFIEKGKPRFIYMNLMHH